MRIRGININTGKLDATIHNEIVQPLKGLTDSIKAGTATDPNVSAVAMAIARGVRKAIVQAIEDSGR